jgi:phosphatidylinositol phosphate synthase
MTGSALGLAAALGLALASMGVFAIAGSRRDADAERRGSHFLMGLGDFLVHWFLWAVTPLERASLRLGLTPDVFNFAGLGLGLASGIALALGRLEAGGWLIVGGGVADVLDGRIARARGLDSDYGKFIDSTLDRFVEVFVLLGLAVALRGRPLGAAVAGAALAGSLLVSYTRARGESLGVLCKEGLMQRAERLVLTAAACLLDAELGLRFGWAPGTAVFWVLAAIGAGTFATAAHRTVWISGRLRARDRARRGA